MIGDESEGGDCDEATWHAQDEVNQEDSEQNEVDGMKEGADVDNIGQPNRQSALTVYGR